MANDKIKRFPVKLELSSTVVIDIGDSLQGMFEFSKELKSYETKCSDFNQVVDFETNKENGNIRKMVVHEFKKQLRMLNFRLRCADGTEYILVLKRTSGTVPRWGDS